MRRIEFDAGHRLIGHSGKCRHIHGHRYAAEVFVSSDKLDQIGMVVDFGEVKRLVGSWIDQNWDHNLLLNQDDPQLLHLTMTEERRPYVMSCNPTAENMARELFDAAAKLLPAGSMLQCIRLWETPTCFAEYPHSSEYRP